MSDYRPRVPALPPPNLSPSTPHGAAYAQPASSMGGRLLGDLTPASSYSMSRLNYQPLVPSDQDLPSYASFDPPSRHMGPMGVPPPMPHDHPTLPAMPIDQGSRTSNMGGQDCPPFEDTKVIYPVVTTRNQQLTPRVDAKIQKGFFKVDGKWTCYRRNYFTVSCAFSLKPATYESHFYLQRHASHQHEPIRAFAMQISAKTAVVNNQESETRHLVQHTPKRDKATETTPGKAILQPVQPAQPSLMGNSTHYQGTSSIYGAPTQIPHNMIVDYDAQQYSSTQNQSPPQSHTFERIQFQKATANNGKRRAQQQYFHVVVELFVDIARYGDQHQWIKIASAQSHPMVVRGRSPGHYKDNRRGSSTSMDPDRGTGGGSDGSGGGPMGSYLGPSHGRSSTMEWESTNRGSSQMGGFRHANRECSPSSSSSLESSSSFGESKDDSQPNSRMKPAASLSSRALSQPGAGGQETLVPVFGLGSQAGWGDWQAPRSDGRWGVSSTLMEEHLRRRTAIDHPRRMVRMETPMQQALYSPPAILG